MRQMQETGDDGPPEPMREMQEVGLPVVQQENARLYMGPRILPMPRLFRRVTCQTKSKD